MNIEQGKLNGVIQLLKHNLCNNYSLIKLNTKKGMFLKTKKSLFIYRERKKSIEGSEKTSKKRSHKNKTKI